MRRAKAVALATMLLAGTAITLAAPAAPAAPAKGAGSGLTSLTLTSIGTDGRPVSGSSDQAALAEDGRYVAFAVGSAIYRRDMISATTTMVSDLATGAATAPDISADGRLISYQQDDDVFVASGRTVHQATGNRGDPRFAHVLACPVMLGTGRVTPCGPRLSADGTTLVYPAELTPVPPGLSVTAASGDDDDAAPLRGDMLDLSGGATAAVSYTNQGFASVPVTGIMIAEPRGFPAGGPFRLGQTTCDQTLSSGSSCMTRVGFDEGVCVTGPRLITGSLVTNSPTPAGQSVIELTALCPVPSDTTLSYHTGPAPTAGRPNCPVPPAGLPLTAAPPATSDSSGTPLSDVGAAEAGRPRVVWTLVNVTERDAQVFFAAANGDDCGIQLVNPARIKLADPLPAGAPAPCGQGEQLRGSATCTAYLLVSAATVAPDVAFLGMICDGGLTPAMYLTMQGVRHVILARRAPGGTGDFATAPATVVSVASDGTAMPDATEPAISATGRYVGFAAPVPDGSAGQQPAAGASEVWLHDLAHTVAPVSTTLVSCLPRPHAGPCRAAPNADSPSLSGSGRQIAFATTAAVVPDNGYQPGSAAATRASPDQVFVRSVSAGTTTLVSSRTSVSYAPAITQDATAVAFASVTARTAHLYLTTARGGDAEIVSAADAAFPPGTRVGVPSLDATGRLTTFPASAALLPAAPEAGGVYTLSRLARLSPAPAAAPFGRVLIDSKTQHRDITVTDTGPGPATVTSVAATGPFRLSRDTCADSLLLAGSRCIVRVEFTPTAASRPTGELTVITQDDGEPPVSIGVPLAAEVPAPRLAISPGAATYGAAIQVSGTGFPPGRNVALTWNAGLGSTVTSVSTSGVLHAVLVIFPDDVVGPRVLRSTIAAKMLATASFLVQKPSTEPPFAKVR